MSTAGKPSVTNGLGIVANIVNTPLHQPLNPLEKSGGFLFPIPHFLGGETHIPNGLRAIYLGHSQVTSTAESNNMTTTNTTNSKIEFVGITDERDTCDKCGKTHLKRVVVLKIDGEFAFYGTDCAAKAISKGGKKVKNSDLQNDYDLIARTQANIAKFGIEGAFKVLVNRGYWSELKNGAIRLKVSEGWVEVK